MAETAAILPANSFTPARSRARSPVGWVLWAIVVANAGVIVYLWLHGGGISGARTGADRLTSIGRITGLLGAYSALLQVLMLSRLPPLERLVGFDRLTVWHRRNGKVCIGLLLAHMVFITWGYQQADAISLGSEISSLANDYPGLITATIGTGLLLLVVISSLVVARRRLPYELWHLVHLTAYVGIALSWSHQIPTGNELTVNATASAYWTALYVFTLAMLVVFRVARPLGRAAYFGLRVASVQREGPGVVSVRITGRHLDRLGARAGQFFLWRFLGRGGRPWEAHPFSLSALPGPDGLRITVKAVGGYTARIGELKPGTRVLAEGPFGMFTGAVRRRESVALIAGGIGITPVRAMVEEFDGDVTVIYRALRDDDIVFRDELDEIAARDGVTVHYVVGDHATDDGARLLTAEHLRELVPDLPAREVYLCGPPAMTNVIAKAVRDADVPRKHIHTERFAL